MATAEELIRGFAPESDVATFTFASEVTGTGGSSGDGDLVPRDRYTYEPL